MPDQESGALASPTGGTLQGRALLSMLQDGDPPQRARASEPQPLSRDETAPSSLQVREDAEFGADALTAETFGADAGQGWSFEESFAANRGQSPPRIGRWADGQGAEQSPGGPGHHDRHAGASTPSELRRRVDELEAESERHRVLVAKSQDIAQMALKARDEARAREADLTQLLAQAGQQQCELRRRVDELESERNWLVYRVATAEDNATRACAALAEVRWRAPAGLQQRLAQMEAVAALGAEPGGA